MTLEERLKKTRDLRQSGFNCAQCVVGAFTDVTKIDDEIALRIASGLGAGVAATGEICGVVSAIAINAGLLDNAEPTAKKRVMSQASSVIDKFRKTHRCVRCCEIKGKENGAPCNTLIEDGVRLFHQYLEEKG